MDFSAPELKPIVAAIALLQANPETGRARLLELWKQLAPEGNLLQRCALAHFLADTETETAGELEWDLRALEAATGSREADELNAVPAVPGSFLPSLHLNVADGYRRSGDLTRARRHAVLGSRHLGALADDGYGNMIRAGLRRLHATLGASRT